MYYGLLSVAAMMFGAQFLFTKIFKDNYKASNMEATAVSGFGSALFGLLFLLMINGARLEYSHFAFIIAFIQALCNFLLTFCSLKALERINLSLYSIFMMLGGMILPFVAGILFFQEELTTGKALCLVLVSSAFLVTFEKGNTKFKASNLIYYLGLFFLNGMFGVLSKIYSAGTYEKISATGYSILTALLSAAIYLVMLLVLKPNLRRLNAKALAGIFGTGFLNRAANLILLIALAHVPASAQYPFITGGTMIASTLLSYCTANKPSKRELISVLISMIGVLALLL